MYLFINAFNTVNRLIASGVDYDCDTRLALTDHTRAEPLTMSNADMLLIDFLQVI